TRPCADAAASPFWFNVSPSREQYDGWRAGRMVLLSRVVPVRDRDSARRGVTAGRCGRDARRRTMRFRPLLERSSSMNTRTMGLAGVAVAILTLVPAPPASA